MCSCVYSVSQLFDLSLMHLRNEIQLRYSLINDAIFDFIRHRGSTQLVDAEAGDSLSCQ